MLILCDSRIYFRDSFYQLSLLITELFLFVKYSMFSTKNDTAMDSRVHSKAPSRFIGMMSGTYGGELDQHLAINGASVSSAIVLL